MLDPIMEHYVVWIDGPRFKSNKTMNQITGRVDFNNEVLLCHRLRINWLKKYEGSPNVIMKFYTGHIKVQITRT